MTTSDSDLHRVSFSNPRSFATTIRSSIKETFFPDDPFRQIKNEQSSTLRAKKAIQYFLPVFEWLPRYNLRSFRYDLLAGVTIASLAIPQGISYAKLAKLPPIIGLYSSFVPPLIYAILGSSKDLAIGTIASGSVLLASIFGQELSIEDNPTLYLHLVFTATFFTGIFQAAMGFFRLGILVDFLSHSTITGFMSGTAIIICLQQLKGVFGLIRFTSKTDVVSVLHSIFSQTHQWRWESALVGIIFLIFLEFTRYLKRKNQKLFFVAAIGPMVTVVVGCIFAYLAHGEKHGIQIVGHLSRGINPPSIHYLNFDPKYLAVTIKASIITGMLALTEGIAIGRSFANLKNDRIDGNKEMIACGTMNIVGSFTSCYLTTGPFSKTAVNYNAGCKTAMSNVVMAICMMLTLLFLAPLFSYTPLVALSAIIMSSMFGLVKYEEAYHLFKVDKFDFTICIAAFIGVIFFDMIVGLIVSVGLSIIRALLYVARPPITNLGNLSNSAMYRDLEQYPSANRVPGIIVLQLGSPIYFANCTYVRERVWRWIEDEQSLSSKKGDIEHVILDMGGVTSIDTTGIEMLFDLEKNIDKKGIKVSITNPKIEVMEKLMLSKFIDKIGKDSVFLSISEAVESCHFALRSSSKHINGSEIDSNRAEGDV